MTDYGKLIKEAREKAGLTQEELGIAIGVTGVTIMRYEKGTRNPSSEIISKIASVLGPDFIDSVIEEIDNSLSEALERKRNADEEFKAKYKIRKNELELQYQKKAALFIEDMNGSEIIHSFYLLNSEGKEEAEKRVYELTQIPKYQAKKQPEEPNTPTDGNNGS